MLTVNALLQSAASKGDENAAEAVNELKTQGIISEEEYEAKKQQILGI